MFFAPEEAVSGLAFYLQADIPEVQGSVLDLLVQTGPVAKVVLLLLLAFSILSWAIIYVKYKRLKQLRTQSEHFLRAFRKAHRLSDFNIAVENFPPHPLKSVFICSIVLNSVAAPNASPAAAPTRLPKTLLFNVDILTFFHHKLIYCA